MNIMSLNGTWNIERIRESVIATASPTLATSKRVMLESPLTFSSTWLPKINKLGSATATKNAIVDPDINMKKTFLLFIIEEPSSEPIGIIDSSIPCKKNVKPAITITIPLAKDKSKLQGNGVNTTCKKSTKRGMGNSEKKTDLSWRLISRLLKSQIFDISHNYRTILASKKLFILVYLLDLFHQV